MHQAAEKENKIQKILYKKKFRKYFQCYNLSVIAVL
jgi:hypothetical protein